MIGLSIGFISIPEGRETAFVLNADLTAQPEKKYIWDDTQAWDDTQVWKD